MTDRDAVERVVNRLRYEALGRVADSPMRQTLHEAADLIEALARQATEPPKGRAVKPEYLRPGFDFALAHSIEEAGEFCAAAGKTLRWGPASVNPELPAAEQETNAVWLRRELSDLRGALDRLEAAMDEELG